MRKYAVFFAVLTTLILSHADAPVIAQEMALRITSIKADSSLSIGKPLTVEICAVAGAFDATNVTGKFVPGEGYDILKQPVNGKAMMGRGDSVVFVGQIVPTKLGTWKVELGVDYLYEDGSDHFCPNYLYIHLSDTLNRAFTAMEYFLLPKGRAYAKPIKKPVHLIPLERFRPSKPTVPDTIKPKPRTSE